MFIYITVGNISVKVGFGHHFTFNVKRILV